MKFPRTRVQPIEDMAFKYLSQHINDKSQGLVARMHRTYGRTATKEALSNAHKLLRMVDPEHPQAKKQIDYILASIYGSLSRGAV